MMTEVEMGDSEVLVSRVMEAKGVRTMLLIPL